MKPKLYKVITECAVLVTATTFTVEAHSLDEAITKAKECRPSHFIVEVSEMLDE